jgi:hypothetical protein
MPALSMFLELEATIHHTDLNKQGDFVSSVTGGIEKGFAMVDIPMLLGLHGHGSHEGAAGHAAHGEAGAHAGHAGGGMATMGDGLAGHGPMVMFGRMDPSTNFPLPTDRPIFHDVPTDTTESGFIVRYGLEPYAFAAKYFGLFKRGDHVLLPTESVLYHAHSAPGVDFHGRLFASRLLYQVGLTAGAHPEFADRFHAMAPYLMLRWDFGDRDGLNGSVGILGNYGREVYRIYYLVPEELPTIPLGLDGPIGQHRPPPPLGRPVRVESDELDVWREGIGANVRRGRWDVYGAYIHDYVYDVPENLGGAFQRRAQGVTAEVDYRLTHSLLGSVRYDWMDAGGWKSDVIFEAGPRDSQVLHLQLRWYVFEGDDLARVPMPALLSLSVRDSVNLTPGGGTHPLANWRNGFFLGFELAF